MEKAFSIFLYIENDYINSIGYVCYPVLTDDQILKKRMQDSIKKDSKIAKKIKLDKPISHKEFTASSRVGNHGKYFEFIFTTENAVEDPFALITPIVKEEPKIDAVTDHSPLRYTTSFQEKHFKNSGTMPDYLIEYQKENGFDIPQLIHDDYYLAIKLLFNNNFYISCAKLLMSCIDTLAFIEYGDKNSAFKLWLDEYTDLSSQNITSNELWELRNGLLHMTNLDSRANLSGKEKRIILYIGNKKETDTSIETGFKPLNLYTLVTSTVPKGIKNWCESYNITPHKFENFVMRYDTVVSDIRLGHKSV